MSKRTNNSKRVTLLENPKAADSPKELDKLTKRVIESAVRMETVMEDPAVLKALKQLSLDGPKGLPSEELTVLKLVTIGTAYSTGKLLPVPILGDAGVIMYWKGQTFMIDLLGEEGEIDSWSWVVSVVRGSKPVQLLTASIVAGVEDFKVGVASVIKLMLMMDEADTDDISITLDNGENLIVQAGAQGVETPSLYDCLLNMWKDSQLPLGEVCAQTHLNLKTKEFGFMYTTVSPKLSGFCMARTGGAGHSLTLITKEGGQDNLSLWSKEDEGLDQERLTKMASIIEQLQDEIGATLPEIKTSHLGLRGQGEDSRDIYAGKVGVIGNIDCSLGRVTVDLLENVELVAVWLNDNPEKVGWWDTDTYCDLIISELPNEPRLIISLVDSVFKVEWLNADDVEEVEGVEEVRVLH